MANREMRFDIFKQPRLTPIIYGRVGDGSVQKVTVYLTANDEPIDLTGYTITFEGNTSGNKTVVLDTEGVSGIVANQGKFDYTFPNMAFGVAGEYERAYFSLTNITTKQRSTTSNFQVIVLDNADITADEAETIITEYNKLIEKLNKAYNDALANYTKAGDAMLADLKNKMGTLESKLNTLNTNYNSLAQKSEEIRKAIEALGNLHVMYSNSLDFGNYDYSGRPNLMRKLSVDDWDLIGAGITKSDGNGEYVIFDFSKHNNDMNVYAGFSHKLPLLEANKKYTLTAEVSTDVAWAGRIRMSYRINKPDGSPSPNAQGTLIGDVNNPEANVWYTLTTMENSHTIPELINTYKSVWLQLNLSNTDFKGKIKVRYNIKIEPGETSTPYQPNLLDEPYYLSKTPLGENIADPAGIISSSYMLLSKQLKEKIIENQTYTITLKGTKPSTQAFRCFVEYESGTSAVNLLDMKPVEGLTDEWQLTFKATISATDITGRLYVYQVPNTSLGQCKIDWFKLEKGDTRTPNLNDPFKYQGVGFQDSDSPKDYIWNLSR